VRKGLFLLTLAVALAGAAQTALRAPRRVMLVSFDGAGGLELAERLKDGTLGPDGFARARRDGFSATRLTVVTPSLTAVSHASISTGAPPSATGLVANWLHLANAQLKLRTSAFEHPAAVETLWEAAARQGKRVASITWPGLSQGTPRQSTPVGIRYLESKPPHSVFWSATTPLADALLLPSGVTSFSPPKSITIPAPTAQDTKKNADVSFVVVDTTDDGKRGYDEILAVTPAGEIRARSRSGGWFALTERYEKDNGDSDVLFGRWGKVLALAPDLSRVSIYLGDIGRTYAQPDDFRRTLDRDAGFWPDPPDPAFLRGPNPDFQSFLEQTARFADYFATAFEVANRRGDWDLLFGYQPIIDEAAHLLTIVDPRQPWYTKERAAGAAAAMREVWRIADRAAARYMKFADRGDVLFVSDHGTRGMIRAIRLAEILKRRGFLKSEKGPSAETVAEDSPTDVVNAGGSAMIVVNRTRLPNGVVTDERARELVPRIVAELRGVKDDKGEPLFAFVGTADEAAALGVAHPNMGDIFLIAAGEASFRWGFDAGSYVGPADYPGQHGFGPDPALDGIFFHVGEGIRPEQATVFDSLDVARRVSSRLGIQPPKAAK